jgi:hypothetical protein
MHTIELIIHFCLAEKYEFIIRPIDLNIGDEGTTPRVLTFGLPAMVQKQDGHSKPKKLKIN